VRRGIEVRACFEVGLNGLEQRSTSALDPLAADTAQDCHRRASFAMTTTLETLSPNFIV